MARLMGARAVAWRAEATADFAVDSDAVARQIAAVQPKLIFPLGDSWYVAGGRSYVAQFLADAGGQYLWADDQSTGTSPLAMEAVYDKVYTGDFWFNTSTWMTLADVLATDPRLAELAAFQSGNIYNNNARLNENGGNDYWESGLANPDVILADLIKILHPTLLPDHELVYYRQLAPTE